MAMRGLMAAALVLASLPHGARAERDVYKCTSANGVVVFSPVPCGKDAAIVDTSRAVKTGTSPNLQGVSDRAALAAIDLDCRAQQRSIDDVATSQANQADREIAGLRAQMRLSANNFAGATRDNGIREQISAAQARKSAALSDQQRQTSELRRECDRRRSDEHQQQADRDRGNP